MKKNKRPHSYEEALSQPSRLIWGGCGDGRCRSCGRIHNFDYKVGVQWVDQFMCWENYNNGCPIIIPKPVHQFENGKCIICGVKARWVSPDGKTFSTIEFARRKGWKRKDLMKEG